jgi:large subunit ribosomal protein L10
MALTRERKKEILEKLKENIEKQKIIIFADFTGLKNKEFFALRKKLKDVGSEMKVSKKTLINLALKEKNLDLIDARKLMGEIVLIFGFADEISPTKVVYEFSKENKNFKILGGILDKIFIGPEKIEELAKLPSKEELLARVVGQISAPISNFVHLLKGVLQNFVFVLSQIQLKVQK